MHNSGRNQNKTNKLLPCYIYQRNIPDSSVYKRLFGSKSSSEKTTFLAHAERHSDLTLANESIKKGEAEFHKWRVEHRQRSVSAVSVIKCQVITET